MLHCFVLLFVNDSLLPYFRISRILIPLLSFRTSRILLGFVIYALFFGHPVRVRTSVQKPERPDSPTSPESYENLSPLRMPCRISLDERPVRSPALISSDDYFDVSWSSFSSFVRQFFVNIIYSAFSRYRDISSKRLTRRGRDVDPRFCSTPLVVYLSDDGPPISCKRRSITNFSHSLNKRRRISLSRLGKSFWIVSLLIGLFVSSVSRIGPGLRTRYPLFSTLPSLRPSNFLSSYNLVSHPFRSIPSSQRGTMPYIAVRCSSWIYIFGKSGGPLL